MSNDLVHPEADARSVSWSWCPPERGEHFRRCSWCGSIHPEDLAAETGWRANWADRKYGWPHKFYIDIPNREPAHLYVIAAASGPHAANQPGYIAWEKLTRAQRKIVRRDGFKPDKDDHWARAFKFGTKAMHHAKFYTVHLADPKLPHATKDKIEQACGLTFAFADGRVTWGAPGDEALPPMVETDRPPAIDLTSDHRIPHCDSSILHAPGVCKYCDACPDWQYYREVARINFTNQHDPNKAPCPSEYFRSEDVRDTWPGNVARSNDDD